jgi:hypothetical protein
LKKEADAKKAAQDKQNEKLKRQNKHDGLIHWENGEKHFFDGGVVGGVNDYLRTHLKKQHEKHSKFVFNQQAAEDEFIRELNDANFAQKYRQNHKKFYSLAVTQSNDENDDIIREANTAALQEAKEKVEKDIAADEKEKDRLAHFNKFTGLIDYGEGKNQFFEGGLVGGINNYA